MLRPRRHGMTLVEMLVAMAISLILIYGMALAFGQVGREASEGRARIDMGNQMRNVIRRLESDLAGLTVPARPQLSSGAGAGYLEYLEGTGNDNTWAVTSEPNIMGDRDDVLMFTSRSEGEPFVGVIRVLRPNASPAVDFTNTYQSQVAEIVWAISVTVEDPTRSLPREFVLHRRALLVRPELGVVLDVEGDLSTVQAAMLSYLNENDVSARVRMAPASGSNFRLTLTANSLSDLSMRENRFAHLPVIRSDASGNLSAYAPTFPYAIVTDPLLTPNLASTAKVGLRQGETVMMSHCIAFDLRAFDATAPLYYDSTNLAERSTVLQPGDMGYAAAAIPAAAAGWGAYVDLNWLGSSGTSQFSGPVQIKSQLRPSSVYDTWTGFYENNGINENAGRGANQDLYVDGGTDGLDNNGTWGVDDRGEYDTLPPYEAPLRGLKATIRLYETDTRQLLQHSLITDFIPE